MEVGSEKHGVWLVDHCAAACGNHIGARHEEGHTVAGNRNPFGRPDCIAFQHCRHVHYRCNDLWEKITDMWNVSILIFLVCLGVLTYLVTIAGVQGIRGLGAKRIKSRAGAQLASLLLGILIFIDDYFNCLTVGTVMIPVTDRCAYHARNLLILSTQPPLRCA